MRGPISITSSRFYQYDTSLDPNFPKCLPVRKQRMLYFSERDITVFKPPTAMSGLLLQTDHVIHLFMMLIHGLVREPASQHFCFLEVEENIWSKHCCPEMLADGKASEREREKESASRAKYFLLGDNCLWWRRGREFDPLLQTHMDLRSLFAGTKKWMLFINLAVYSGWQTLEFPCHFDLSYISPC